MPGTIKASVVKLMEIPSSASPSSTVSVKLAMGTREFQNCDKGDFSFPLTTLRDYLIITLHDANGNEISRTDVPTMPVVQKGVWDDLFSLHGGGLVHMKLQFILSEEERRRIQDMRYSALEKKKEELVKGTYTHLETQIILSAVDLQEIAVPAKALSFAEKHNKVSILDTIQSGQPLQSASDSKGHRQVEMAPINQWTCFNNTEGGETSSTYSLSKDVHKDSEHSSEGRAFHFTGANSNSSEDTRLSDTRSISAGIKQKSILSQKSLDALLRCSVSSPSLVSTGSSSSVASTPGQDVTCKPEMKSLPARSPSTVRKMISAFETNLTQSSSQQQSKNHNTRRKDQDGSKRGPLELSGGEHKTAEGTDSKKGRIEPSRCLGLDKGGWKACRDDSNSLTLYGASKVKQELVVDSHFQQCLFDSHWNWILQEETRDLCITTASKQLRNAVERSCITRKERQPMAVNLSTTEEIQMHDNNCTEVKEKMASHTFNKSNHVDSRHASITPQVLIAQAIKVGIIVVCGAIFVSTR